MNEWTKYTDLIEAAIVGDRLSRSVLGDMAEEAGDAEATAFWRRSASPTNDTVTAVPKTLKALLPTVQKHWNAVVLSCDSLPSNEELLSLYGALYAVFGLDAPAAIFREVDPSKGDALASSVGRDHSLSARMRVAYDDMTEVTRSHGGWYSVYHGVGGPRHDRLRNWVHTQLPSYETPLAQSYHCGGAGTMGGGLLAVQSAFDLMGVSAAVKLRPLAVLSRRVGWWWGVDGGVIVSPPPSAIYTDGDQFDRVEWAGGMALFATHGV